MYLADLHCLKHDIEILVELCGDIQQIHEE